MDPWTAFPSEALEENPSPCLFQLLEALCIPGWLLPLSSKSVSKHLPVSLSVILSSHSCSGYRGVKGLKSENTLEVYSLARSTVQAVSPNQIKSFSLHPASIVFHIVLLSKYSALTFKNYKLDF